MWNNNGRVFDGACSVMIERIKYWAVIILCVVIILAQSPRAYDNLNTVDTVIWRAANLGLA